MRLFMEFEGKIKILEVKEDAVVKDLLAHILKDAGKTEAPNKYKFFYEGKSIENIAAPLKDCGIVADRLIKVLSVDECSGSQVAYESFGPNTDMEALDKNLLEASKEVPEALASFTLKYVKLNIGNENITALIDTGSPISIISEKAAERCGIRNLMDARWPTPKELSIQVIGRIMKCAVKSGGSTLLFSFVVVPDEAAKCELLLGIDMLHRHGAQLDWTAKELKMNPNIRIPFFAGEEATKQKTEKAKTVDNEQ